MKWPPSEFWRATPYDVLLAAAGLAKTMPPKTIDPRSKLTTDDVNRLHKLATDARAKEIEDQKRLNDGNG